MVTAVLLGIGKQAAQGAGILFLELVYILPVALIFAWRRISWKHLGFGKFSLQTMALGCGTLVIGYIFILLHNIILSALKIDTQGDQISKIFSQLNSPVWLFLASVVIAPLVEEIFFRGFLFQGFRQKYGWVAAIFLSSFFFAAAHLDPVAFIPTFILGCVLAYIYHRSNSLWPGIIFHFIINGSALTVLYLSTQYPNLIPS
jgi:membrane protease YdiL (CAAX protease family)